VRRCWRTADREYGSRITTLHKIQDPARPGNPSDMVATSPRAAPIAPLVKTRLAHHHPDVSLAVANGTRRLVRAGEGAYPVDIQVRPIQRRRRAENAPYECQKPHEHMVTTSHSHWKDARRDRTAREALNAPGTRDQQRETTNVPGLPRRPRSRDRDFLDREERSDENRADFVTAAEAIASPEAARGVGSRPG